MEDINKITKNFNNAQEFNNKLSNYINTNIQFGDKTAKEWKKYFFIRIPDEITFQTLIDLSGEIFIKYQQASTLRDKEAMQLTILEQSKIDKYNFAYQQARTNHEKKFNKGLAQKSCEIEASLTIKNIEDAISNQKLAKDFWKATCDTLTELRKLLEMIGYALSNDVKVNRDFNIMTSQK